MCKARDIHLFPSLSPPHYLTPLPAPPPPLLPPTFFFLLASHLIHIHIYVVLIYTPFLHCHELISSLIQGIGVVKEEESSTRHSQIQVETRVRPHKEQALSCPRCNSTNTKFCYYNNYSLSQPRYFCKTCRRYWTEGGSLRNVPVGGGSRKNKRSSSSSPSISSSASSLTSSTAASAAITAAASLASSSSTSLQPSELIHPSSIPLASSKFYQGGHDLNLSFPNQCLSQELGGFPSSPSLSVAASAGVRSLSALELLRSGISARGLGTFGPPPMPPPGSVFGADFGFQEFMRPSNMKMQLDGAGGGGYGGSMQEGGGGRLLFPFEDLKQVPISSEAVENEMVRGQGDPSFFWNGIMGNDGGGTSNGGGGGGSW